MPKAKAVDQTEQDAISMLKEDHQTVDKLFKEFEGLKDGEKDEQKADCVGQICKALTVHATIEEEIFYPAAREALEEQDLLDEAEVEHAGVKQLVGELENMSPGDELYDAKVTVLAEYVKHHVKEEEGQMFPKVKRAGLDTEALGGRMAERRDELEAESPAPPAAKRSSRR